MAEDTEIDVEALDQKGVAELRDRLRDGQDVRQPAKQPDPEPVEPDEDEDDDADEGEPEEAKAEQPDKAPDAKPKADTVDFKRYDHERNRRKDVEAKNKKLEADNAEIMRQFRELAARLNPPQQQQPQIQQDVIPDDPMGKIDWLIRNQQKQANETQQERQQRETREQQESQTRTLINNSQVAFKAAAAADPELQPAYNYLLNSLAGELKAFGILNEAELNQKLQETELQHIAYATQKGFDLADYVKALAGSRGFKYVPPQPELAADAQSGVTEQVKRASASLTQTGGAPAKTGRKTAEDVANMTPAEYSKWREKGGSMSDIFMN